MTRTLNQILTATVDKDDSKNTDRFFPKRPETLEQTGLHQIFLEDLVCKILLVHCSLSGQEITKMLGLPMKVMGHLMNVLKQRLISVYQNTAGFNDFYYALPQQGRQKAQLAREQGEAPLLLYCTWGLIAFRILAEEKVLSLVALGELNLLNSSGILIN